MPQKCPVSYINILLFVSVRVVGVFLITVLGLLIQQDAEEDFHLDRYMTSQDISDELGNLNYISSATNIAAALTLARKYVSNGTYGGDFGDRPKIRDFCLLLADGVANREVPATRPAAEALRAAGGMYRAY